MFKKKSKRSFKFGPPRDGQSRLIPFLLGVYLVVIICLLGCRTVPSLPAVNLSESGWSMRQGQVVWSAKRGAPEIAGELVVATNAEGRAFVQFTKTPVPFLVAQSTTNSWQLHSVPDNRTFSGRGNPPIRAIWLWLPRCLKGTAPPKPFTWTHREDGNWRLQNNATGEFLEGYLSP
jgi:hypothetical protein